MVTAKTVQRVTLTRTGKKVSGLQNHVGELNMHGILFRAARPRLISRSIMFSDGVGVMGGRRAQSPSARPDKSEVGLLPPDCTGTMTPNVLFPLLSNS